MPLAGIGSRFIALLVDYLIWSAAFFVLALLFAVFLPGIPRFQALREWAVAIVIFYYFPLQLGLLHAF